MNKSDSAKTLRWLTAALLVVIALMQLMPFWTITTVEEKTVKTTSSSIAGYVWFPSSQGEMASALSARAGGEVTPTSLAAFSVIAIGCGLVLAFLNLFMAKLRLIPFVTLLFAVVNLYGFVSHSALHFGAESILYICILADVALIGLSLSQISPSLCKEPVRLMAGLLCLCMLLVYFLPWWHVSDGDVQMTASLSSVTWLPEEKAVKADVKTINAMAGTELDSGSLAVFSVLTMVLSAAGFVLSLLPNFGKRVVMCLGILLGVVVLVAFLGQPWLGVSTIAGYPCLLSVLLIFLGVFGFQKKPYEEA